jgi:hypothetical protein
MIGNQFDIRYGGVYAPPMRFLPKQEADRDEDYKKFIRSLPCLVCKRPSPSCAHHHPLSGHSSIGLKTSDYRTVPLCGQHCHPRVHQIGKLSLWGNLDDVEPIIVRLNMQYFFNLDVSHI